MVKILMIEDDPEFAEILTEYLKKKDCLLKNVEDPFLGLSTLGVENFDLVILDLTLPGMDGLEVCREIRKKCDIPIIVSSARHDLNDKINALEYGADDYLPKPYNPRELEARIKTILRRKSKIEPEKLQAKKDNIKIDDLKMEIVIDDKRLILTKGEFEILKYLIKKDGAIASREELAYNIDSIDSESSNKSIDVIISRIRVKLGENFKDPKHIKSIRGMGYKFDR